MTISKDFIWKYTERNAIWKIGYNNFSTAIGRIQIILEWNYSA